LMALGVVFTTGTMLTLYFIDWAAIGSMKVVDEGSDSHYEFTKHISANNLNFQSKEEYQMRYRNFQAADAVIKAHNAKDTKFKLAHNFFSTMTDDEMKKYRSDPAYFAPSVNKQSTQRRLSNELGATSLPSSVNWITSGAVNPVKNQGSCGSCYSFGSTAAIEASIFNNGFDLPNLSEQQIVSCSQSYGNNGCNGGNPMYVFNYLQNTYQ